MAVDERMMEGFIRALPKAELHLHIEGALEPELMMALADKHGMALPYGSVEEVRAAFEFNRLQDFLDIYYAGAGVLLDEDDFYQLTASYMRRARSEGIVHAEIFFDPQTHTQRGVSFETVIDGILRALDEAAEAGVSSRLILCFLRHLSEEQAFETLETALPYLDRIAAVGLDSAEAGNPPEKFARVFARAAELGLPAVAHAGEEGPPEYIRQALDQLHVKRVDHGVLCESDAALCERLAEERIPLTVCPLSNIKLRVFDTMADHNLRRLMDRGLVVTINSDDPSYFGGYVVANYLAAWQALDLTIEDIRQLVRNSIGASFLPEHEKVGLLQRVDGVPSPR